MKPEYIGIICFIIGAIIGAILRGDSKKDEVENRYLEMLQAFDKIDENRHLHKENITLQKQIMFLIEELSKHTKDGVELQVIAHSTRIKAMHGNIL